MKRIKSQSYPLRIRAGNTTVAIYKRTRADGSPGFEVADYSTGTRKLRSFPTAATARAEAERIAFALARGDAAAAAVNGKDAASYARALELLRPTGQSLELVASTYAKAYADLGGDRIGEAVAFFLRNNPDNLTQRTVAEVVAEMLAQREADGVSACHLRDLRGRLSRFAKAFQVPMASITAADMQRWLDGLKVGPRSKQNFRKTTRNLFSYAQRRNHYARGSNPASEAEVPSANGDTVEIFTPSEMVKLLAASSTEFLPALALGAFAGLRTAELQRIAWSDVDLAGGFITITAKNAKTRTRRIVPIQTNLALWLAPHARKIGKVWRGTLSQWGVAQEATAAASGVVWKRNACRHSYASYRLAATQSAAQVSLECGNTPAVIFAHYRELVRPDAAAAWFAIMPSTGRCRGANKTGRSWCEQNRNNARSVLPLGRGGIICPLLQRRIGLCGDAT